MHSETPSDRVKGYPIWVYCDAPLKTPIQSRYIPQDVHFAGALSPTHVFSTAQHSLLSNDFHRIMYDASGVVLFFGLKSYGISEFVSTGCVKYSTCAGALAQIGVGKIGRGTFVTTVT